MLLPARMAVLNYLSSVENADVNEIMEAMRPLYGKERQFTKDAYLDDKDELSLRFAINDDGRAAVEKYVPAKYRNK